MSDYKTKRDVDAEIGRLKKLRKELPEDRPVSDGWSLNWGGATVWLDRLSPCKTGLRRLVSIAHDGITITPDSGEYLDGIAHDSRGRIKVVGYVNAEELKTWMYDNLPHKSLSDFNGRPIFEGRAMQQMWDIIDELAG